MPLVGNSEMTDKETPIDIATIKNALDQANPSTRREIFEKFALAAMGSIPWVGGFLSAAASFATKTDGASK
jgi:hypothetical protein